MLKWIRFAALIVALLPLAVHAQSAQGWEVVTYWEQSDTGIRQGYISVITAFGITESFPVPNAIYPTADAQVIEVAVSPDRRWIAVSTRSSDYQQVFPVRVADLTLQTCCTEIAMNAPVAGAYDLGGFDQSGTMFALSYVGETNDPNNFAQLGGLMVYSLTLNQIILDQPMSDTPVGGTWATLLGWESDGVRLYPNCWACDGNFGGALTLWNPLMNTFVNSGETFSIFAETLPATGEKLVLNQITSLPYNLEPSMFDRFNVISYAADGVVPSEPNQLDLLPVAFFDPTNFDLTDGDEMHWVNDGESFIVSNPADTIWTTVSRTGGQRAFNVPADSSVLTGTPDGWLNLERGLNGLITVSHYTLSDANIQRQPFGTLGNLVMLVSAPPLGNSLGEAPPPFLPVPGVNISAPPTNFTCEGVSVPPRLVVGQQGQVTPGAPNNLRAEPSTNAVIGGQIPGNAVFDVLEGPFCAQGFIWWRVGYNGMGGYTVEAAGSEYYVLPFGG